MRGRKRTPESIQKRIAAIDEQYELAGALSALQLFQERKNLDLSSKRSLPAMESTSIDCVRRSSRTQKSYGAAKGIVYGTWREIGVPADVLRDAEIGRSR